MIAPSSSDFVVCRIVLVDIAADFCPLVYGSGICSPRSRMIEGFELIGQFALSGSGTNLAENETTFLSGSRCLAFDKNTSSTTAGIQRTAISPEIDFTQYTTLRCAFYIPNSATLGVITTLRVVLSDDDSFTNISNYDKTTSLAVGWNFVTCTVASPTSTSGAPTRTAVSAYKFVVVTSAAGSLFTAPVSVDDLISVQSGDGFPCFNTAGFCQDLHHYATQFGSKTYRYTIEGSPAIKGLDDGGTILPCIKKDGIRFQSSKIEMARGLGIRDSVEISMFDFEDGDQTTDPYINQRSSTQGTYWRKYMARNKYLKNRYITVREGYGYRDSTTPAGSVFVDLTQFEVRQYVIDRVDGPDSQGNVKFIAKDPLKLSEGVLIPAPSEAVVAESIELGETTIVLEDGDADALLEQAGGVLPFLVCFDKEYVSVGGVSDPNLTGCARAQEGTTEATHDVGSKAQWVCVLEGMPDEVLNDILDRSGVPSSLVDAAGNQTEADTWMAEYNLRAPIGTPTKADKLISDLARQTSAFVFWDAESQLIKYRGIHPIAPGQTILEWSDEASFQDKSVSVTLQEDKRLTSCLIYYGIRDWSEDLDKAGNYQGAQLYIDVEAEKAYQYGDVKTETILAYFFPLSLRTSALSAASQLVFRYVDPPKALKAQVTDKDAASVIPSDVVSVDTFAIVDQFGASLPSLFFVTSKRRISGGGILVEYEAESFVFSADYGSWNTETAPDYADATEAEREYAYWCDETETILGDGPDRWQ